jgi:DNA-binding NarL/FixJ family response regulator
MMTIKIIIADDHKIMRDGLRNLLEKEPDIDVIGEAQNGIEAVKLVCKLVPDVLIVDIGMPDLNGIEATRQILSRTSNVKVIALSMHSDKRFIAGMLSAGAAGYLLKHSDFEELIEAIHCVTKNKIYLSPEISGTVVSDYIHKLSPNDLPTSSVLTQREREVLQQIAEGKSTKQIASGLHVSVKTIESHRQRIMAKLDINSVAELTKYAIREGLTSLET